MDTSSATYPMFGPQFVGFSSMTWWFNIQQSRSEIRWLGKFDHSLCRGTRTPKKGPVDTFHMNCKGAGIFRPEHPIARLQGEERFLSCLVLSYLDHPPSIRMGPNPKRTLVDWKGKWEDRFWIGEKVPATLGANLGLKRTGPRLAWPDWPRV